MYFYMLDSTYIAHRSRLMIKIIAVPLMQGYALCHMFYKARGGKAALVNKYIVLQDSKPYHSCGRAIFP